MSRREADGHERGGNRLARALLTAVAAVLVAIAVAADGSRLTWPWVGGAGGRATGAGLRLEGAAGQPAAGLAGGPAHRLCAGAACVEGEVPPPPTPPHRLYLPAAARSAPMESP